MTTPELIATIRSAMSHWGGSGIWACQVQPLVERVVNRLEQADRELDKHKQSPVLFESGGENERRE
jgi:hypothetical protein